MGINHMAAHGDGDHCHAPVGFQQAVDQIGALDLIAHMGQKAVLSFAREKNGRSAGVAVNRGAEPALAELPWKGAAALELNTGRRYLAVNGVLRVEVPAMEALRLESAEV